MRHLDETEPENWSWLDRWLAVRWRALLTWVMLASLGGLVLDLGVNRFILTTALRSFDYFWGRPQANLLRMYAEFIAGNCQLAFLIFWFEPIVLQLNLPRGLAWISLRTIPEFLPWLVLPVHMKTWMLPSALAAALLMSSALLIPILRGSRSRPWMSVIAGAITTAVMVSPLGMRININLMFASLMKGVPYAVVLLYGTRLLRHEERAFG